MKLPVLVQHYKEHKAMYNGLSFFAFLSMHYLNDNLRDADFHRDMQLPFKAVENNTNISVFILTIQGFELSKTYDFTEPSFIAVNRDSYSSSHFDDIWQPPKAQLFPALQNLIK